MNLKYGYYKVLNTISNNSANILTGCSIFGVVGTAVLTAKCTPKAIQLIEEKEEYKQREYNESLTLFEKAIAATPAYFPAILMGATTITCIYGSNHINKKHQAALSGAYMYLNQCYDEYKNKVKEIYGEDANDIVDRSLMIDKYHEQSEEVIEEDLYYDDISNRYFNFDSSKLRDVLYDINKLYNFMGEVSLNNVYEFLGLEPTPYGDTVGWSAIKDWEVNGFSWIDITMEPLEFPDNFACGVLTFNIDPSNDFKQWAW